MAEGVMTPEQLQRRVTEVSNLPTLPGVVRLLSRMVEDEKTSAQDVGEVVSKDQVLSAKLLRLVNSPVYGFPGRISSVNHALVLLGFNVVKGLVLGTAVFDHLSHGAEGLWEHSLGTAVISRRIAKEMRIPEAEEMMIGGLLHDLGKVILSHLAPDNFAATVKLAEVRGLYIGDAEREVFGVDHARVASWVAETWHLPMGLRDALTYHHAPARAKSNPQMTAVVHVADILARGMGYGHPGDLSMPHLDHDAFQSLRLSYSQIDKILAESEAEYISGVDLYTPGGH